MSVVLERIPQFIIKEPSLTQEQSGDPRFNFLLKNSIEVSEEAFQTVLEQGEETELAPFFQIGINGGVIGEQAKQEGWGNIEEHLFLTKDFVKAGAKIARFDRRSALMVEAAAVIHDADTRIAKEHMPHQEITINGITTLIVDQRALFKNEMTDEGPTGVPGLEAVDPRILRIAGVTHAKFDNLDLWTPEQKLMRLADSSIGSTRDENGAYTQDVLMYPEERAAILKKRKPVFDELGIEIYGKPTFDKWLEATHLAEWDLRQLAEQQNPALLWGYFYDNPQKTRLGDLIGDVMTNRVITPPLNYM